MTMIKRTPLGKSYWNHEGAYQNELDELTEKMPATGAAETLNGELVRAVNRLYYEYCNNGNCNACDLNVEEVDTGFLDDDGNVEYEEEETRDWNPYYKKFFDLIYETCSRDLEEQEQIDFAANMDSLEEMVTWRDPGFSDDEMQVYDYMVDVVVWYVLSHEDKELPAGYERE